MSITIDRREELERQREMLLIQLENVEAAIRMLGEHPELEAFMDTLEKAGL